MKETLGVLLGLVERVGIEPPVLPSGAKALALVESFPRLLLGPLLTTTASLNETLEGRDRDDVALAQSMMDSVGKAAAKLAIAMELFRQVRPTKAGTLGKLLASDPQIAALEKRIELREMIRFGKGESSKPNRETSAIKATARLCALVYLTEGLPQLMDLLRPECTATRNTVPDELDAKTSLQEFTQEHLRLPPSYKLVDTKGPDHDREFVSEARVGSHSTIGKGPSKRRSEQVAAAKLLAHLQRCLKVSPRPQVAKREEAYFKLTEHDIPSMHLRLFPEIERSLSYRFREPRWLSIALTHASGRNEARSGERLLAQEPLALLGGYVFALHGYECAASMPVMWREELINYARRVAMATNTQALAQLARGLQLHRALVFGRGQATREADSILADAIQACAAACVLDNECKLSFDTEPAPFALVRSELRSKGTVEALLETDPKTVAQEILQATSIRAQYTLRTGGPHHAVRHQASLHLTDGTQRFSIDGEAASSKTDAERIPARFLVQVARECHVTRGASPELRALQAFVLRNLVETVTRDATGWRALARMQLLGAHALLAGTPGDVLRAVLEIHRSLQRHDLHELWPTLVSAGQLIERGSQHRLIAAMREFVQRLNSAIARWNPTESPLRAADIAVVRELSDVIALAGRFSDGLASADLAALVDDISALKLKRIQLHVTPPDVSTTEYTAILCPGLTEEILAGWTRRHLCNADAEADALWCTVDDRIEFSVRLRDGRAHMSDEGIVGSRLGDAILESVGCHVQQTPTTLKISLPCIRGSVHEEPLQLALAICRVDEYGSQLLREFAKLCHDLKNVLAAIDNRRDLAASEPSKRYHHLAAVEGLHASGKSDLARVTALLNQQLTIVWERFDLRALLQHFVAALAPSLPSGVKARIHIDLAESLIDGDPRLIESALTNLCKNALEAMIEGGVLAIDAVREDSAVRIMVRDSGGGIPAEAIAALGQRRTSTSPKTGGSGVGLLAVQSIVRSHGGSFAISAEGTGTVATIELRCITVHEPVHPVATAPRGITSVTTGAS